MTRSSILDLRRSILFVSSWFQLHSRQNRNEICSGRRGRVRGSLGEFEARPAVTDDPASIGAVDVALLTLKAHSLIEMAPRLSPLLGPDTCVVSAQNGIPWWYFYRHGGPWEGTRL